jgi:hypothetical protein
MVGSPPKRWTLGILAPVIKALCVVTVRESEVRRVCCEIKQRGSGRDEQAPGVRQGKTGYRQGLQVE